MAATTVQVFKQITPNAEVKCVSFSAVSAANGDTVTVSPFTTVYGCLGTATDGTPMTFTISGSSNVITVKNGGTKTWLGLAWGV